MRAGFAKLLEKAGGYLPAEKLTLVRQAYEFAESHHRGQNRLSGEPFIEHPLQTALLLAELHLDAPTLAAGLLHDVVEDCDVAGEELEEKFGPEVARLVDGVTKLTRIDRASIGDGWSPSDDGHNKAESIRKMLVAMAQDIRVVVIKLGDRIHNMRTLGAQSDEQRSIIAQETLDIYAPLAHRLGIWEFKWQLEDLAFRHLQPQAYRRISRLLSARREEREDYIRQVCDILRAELAKADIKAQVYGRPKHIYSIYRKMQKYAESGKEFGHIYDLYAVRVLVDTKTDCYNALGVAHNFWRPIPGQFNDYIANPKDNMYQALHTTVMCEEGTPLEVQIRTYEMHHIAEYGVAAHWAYKEGSTRDKRFEERMTWLRQLVEWQREVTGAEEFLESIKTDIFKDQVFVYTPKGHIRQLPKGATPIDFAYHIHTDLGHRCMGAKVNGRLVALDYQLQNGDTVEIVASKTARGPSLDWLNPELGYLHTASGLQKVRQWFRRQERSANVGRGRDVLQRELRHLNLTLTDEAVAEKFKYDSMEEFLAALGSGSLSISQVTTRLTAEAAPQVPTTPSAAPSVGPVSGVRVLGVGDLLTRTARCCNPLPGDDIVGYITRSRGITIHRHNCRNITSEDEKERIVPVSWAPTQQVYPARVRIESWDRVALLKDITTIVSGEKVNIASLVTTEQSDGTVIITLTLHTTGIAQLSRLLAKIEGVKGVLNISRADMGAAVPQDGR